MNTKKYMIIFNGQIKTDEIKSCEYNRNTNRMDVVFYRDNSYYSCACDNVERLEEPQIINHNVYRFYRNGKEFNNIKTVYVFKGKYNSYFHICFRNDTERSYKETDL
ncbi:MAG: hypothetical protein IJ982_07425, partial [Fibrobacter sp.]|nr:hypothetical protein [Fibrobacter sp.]